MLHNGLLNLWFAQHVSGTIMPIIRSLRLYRCSQHVAHNLGCSRSLVWCEAVGYASGLGGCCTSNIPQPGRRCVASSRFSLSLNIIEDARTNTHPAVTRILYKRNSKTFMSHNSKDKFYASIGVNEVQRTVQRYWINKTIQ